MPDSQRSRKQWRKARHAETCVCVPTHSSTAIHLTTAAEIPTQSTHLPQKNRKETSPLTTGPFSQFCPHDQEKKRKNPRQANITFKATMALLFSLQRQDLLFRSLRQEGLITAPHQHCRQVSSRLQDSLPAPSLIPQRVAGMGRHSVYSLTWEKKGPLPSYPPPLSNPSHIYQGTGMLWQ